MPLSRVTSASRGGGGGLGGRTCQRQPGFAVAFAMLLFLFVFYFIFYRLHNACSLPFIRWVGRTLSLSQGVCLSVCVCDQHVSYHNLCCNRKKDINGSDKLRLTRQSHVSARREQRKGHTKVKMANSTCLSPGSWLLAPTPARHLLCLYCVSVFKWNYIKCADAEICMRYSCCQAAICTQSQSQSQSWSRSQSGLIFPHPLTRSAFLLHFGAGIGGNSWKFTFTNCFCLRTVFHIVFLCMHTFVGNCPSTNWLLTDQFFALLYIFVYFSTVFPAVFAFFLFA